MFFMCSDNVTNCLYIRIMYKRMLKTSNDNTKKCLFLVARLL